MFVNMPADYNHALVRLKDNPAAEQYQVDLVRRSIEDIETALEKWRAVEADPASSEEDRARAAQRIAWRERDFGGQWCNVLAILKRLA